MFPVFNIGFYHFVRDCDKNNHVPKCVSPNIDVSTAEIAITVCTHFYP